MRNLSIAVAAFAITACSTAPESVTRTANAQAELQQLIAGRSAGGTVACLSHHRTDQMVVIDDNTVAFKDGQTVYVNNLRGPCSGLGSGFYALRTQTSGGIGLCRGDIAEVVDTNTGFARGSCSLGDFVTYRRS
jgi:hypothetical protein